MDNLICIGDRICLFCEDTKGYIAGYNSSDAFNNLVIHVGQEKEAPVGIQNPHAVAFEVCWANRYTCEKAYRSLVRKLKKLGQLQEKQDQVNEAKANAAAEAADNEAENRRQRGRHIKYGQAIQLRHILTGKYLHVNATRNSNRDKNSMQVELHDYNAKTAQFKFQSRFRVKSDGDIVQEDDQVYVESVKSNSRFLHASTPWNVTPNMVACELNINVEFTTFSVIKYSQAADEGTNYLKGGDIISLSHCEIDAYLSAQGIVNSGELEEDVHLSVRVIDPTKPLLENYNTSAISYWQVEHEETIVKSMVLHWEHQVRIRHVATHLYLRVSEDGRVGLTPDGRDPRTVFRFYAVMEEQQEIIYGSYCFIMHVLSGTWLNAASRDDPFVSDVNSVFNWDVAEKRKAMCTEQRLYANAFTIEELGKEDQANFYMVSGTLPYILMMLSDVESTGQISYRTALDCMKALQELEEYMIVNGEPVDVRQKLLRNLKIVDLLTKFLQSSVSLPPKNNLGQLRMQIYRVMETYLRGDSRTNELYFAKYIPWFSTQFDKPGGDGVRITTMITELIRDNRVIIEKLSQDLVDNVVGLLKQRRDPHYLDLLSVLCVCDEIAMPDCQTYIVKQFLETDNKSPEADDKESVFLTELGEKLGRVAGRVYVSTNGGNTFTTLAEFCDHKKSATAKEDYKFLESQLELFGELCKGRNSYCIDVITQKLGYLTWQEALACLSDEEMPDALRAKYCELIVDLFINAGSNRSVVDKTTYVFKYEQISDEAAMEQRRLENMDLFAQLKPWIARFLDSNKDMTASDVGHNKLIEEVLRLVHELVRFGYYWKREDITKLVTPLLSLLDGRNDKPFRSRRRGAGDTKTEVLEQYRRVDRFLAGLETKAVVDAKYRAMEVVGLLLNMQNNVMLEKFVALFKKTEQYGNRGSWLTKSLRKSKNKKKVNLKDVIQIVETMSFFNEEELTEILLDLSKYQYDKMVHMSVLLLNRVYSTYHGLFTKAVQAQVLITTEYLDTNALIEEHLTPLRQASTHKIGADDVAPMEEAFETFAKLCHLTGEPDERHPLNQSLFLNHGVLDVCLAQMKTIVTESQDEEDHCTNIVMEKLYGFLEKLCRGNAIVQQRIFDNLDLFLTMDGNEESDKNLALVLTQVFTGNQDTCLKISEEHIERIIARVASNSGASAEFIDVLCALVKVEELNLPLVRNQNAVILTMVEKYRAGTLRPLDEPAEYRQQLLRMQGDSEDLSYLMSVADLVATCSEGENAKLEYICQSLVKLPELVDIMNDPSINNNLKRPFIRYVLWAYLNTEISLLECGATDLPEQILPFLQALPGHLTAMTEYCSANAREASLMLKRAPPKGALEDTIEGHAYGTLHFFFDATLPFLEVLCKKGFTFAEPDQADAINEIAKALLKFNDAVRTLIHQKQQMNTLRHCISSLLAYSSVAPKDMKRFLTQTAKDIDIGPGSSVAKDHYEGVHKGELDLNERLNEYAIEAKKLYAGVNSVEAQLGWKREGEEVQIRSPSRNDSDGSLGTIKRWDPGEYTEIGDDEELPLSAEFQKLVQVFSGGTEKYQWSEKLVEQLHISATKLSLYESARPDQVELDANCLRVLRAMIHNTECKLPKDVMEHPTEDTEHLVAAVVEVQDALNNHGALLKTLSLVNRKQDEIVREFLAFLAAMLSKANKNTQKAFLDYFKGTRQDTFLVSLQARMKRSIISAKSRRILAAVADQRARAAKEMAATLRLTISRMDKLGLKPLDENRNASKSLNVNGKTSSHARVNPAYDGPVTSESHQSLDSHSWSPGPGTPEGSTLQIVNKHGGSKTPSVAGSTKGDPEKPPLPEAPPLPGEENAVDLKFHDEGNIELVLKVLALMCDGQNRELQDYLREQQDNMGQVNMVAEAVYYMKSICSSINSDNIGILIQLIDTLNEMAVGNTKNHLVMFDSQLVDHINVMLRANNYGNSSAEQVIELKNAIGRLLMSMAEENLPKGDDLVKKKGLPIEDLCSALDLHGVVNMVISVHKELNGWGPKENKEKLRQVGFNFFFLLERIEESTDAEIPFHSPEEEKCYGLACEYYKGSRRIVEVLKDGLLHRIRFQIHDPGVLRQEVKEQMKWNVDRTSSSNKIRDLMDWSSDIIDDVNHQRKIRANPLLRTLVGNWTVWNSLVILLSVVINIIMLAVWHAKGALGETDLGNSSGLPSSITDPVPNFPSWYPYAIYGLGAVHIIFSLLVTITFFVSSKPKLPTLSSFRGPPEEPRIRERLFGFKTFYYLMVVACSVLGIFFYGYFFAFHLLNIVYNNQILQRVIRAVTLNSSSLIWTFLLGVIVLYLFALLAFATFRDSFDPDDDWPSYCGSLAQCTAMLIRYGLVGEIFEVMLPHENTKSFDRLGWVSLYSIAFFIIVTTIGLNIIFGIILDTFNQLRGEQEAAAADMKSCCFICGRESFEFETHGGGFDKHVRDEHNMWDYIYLLLHLRDTLRTDYTTLELFVANELDQNSHSFFPVGQAMSLATKDEDEQAEMMHKIMEMMGSLLRKQEKEEIAKHLEEERRRQEEWERQYRNA